MERTISIDTDVDAEVIISDDDNDTADDDLFLNDDDVASSRTPAALLPRNAADTSESQIHFAMHFEERYGDFHPPFYMGPLVEAISEAAGSTTRAAERKPLLLYLHHDASVLTNIFCSQILCSEHFVTYASQNFVTWAWDATDNGNREQLVGMLAGHFGEAAGMSMTRFSSADYPLLLIVMKTKGGFNVVSTLQANNSLDELMSALLNGYEVFEQANMVDTHDENERNAREEVKLEQEAAYQESLAVDMAKVAAERERMRRVEEAAEDEQLSAQMREAERLSLIDQLPVEPTAGEPHLTTLRFRLPDGDTVVRRFRASDKLKIVFMFMATKQFHSPMYRLLSWFPRREVALADSDKTLQELKLSPQETIFIEERD